MTIELEKIVSKGIEPKGGDMSERDGQPPERFFHAHMYESEDGLEFQDWDQPSTVVIDVAREIDDKRRDLGLTHEEQLVPDDNVELRELLFEGLKKIRAQRKAIQTQQPQGVMLFVSMDGTHGEYRDRDGTLIRTFAIDPASTDHHAVEPTVR